jgi:HD-GYP domain-containing protein (c-di-GMP phosphodiesterase class II)
MALADVFDALMTRRVYKPPMTLDETTKIIVDGRGKHFDPAVVDAFIACRERFAEIAARYADPVTEQAESERLQRKFIRQHRPSLRLVAAVGHRTTPQSLSGLR